jgi:tRNA(Ile)-lysidine synthase
MLAPALRRPPAVGRVIERVTATARRYRMFDPGTRVLVAVSGGPDSVCLLHSLVRLQRLLKIEPACFHFDHGLRKGSADDASYVRGQAKRLGVPFFIRRATARPARGDSVEAWARTVRYQALTNLLEELGGGVAAVGHTADDQAETVLLALLRGGGLEAIGGMKPVSNALVRPLLETTREETEAFCRSLRLRPRRDPMNEDPAFMRVGIRTRVIPQLERALGRNLRSTLVRTADLLRHDAEFLDQLAAAARSDVVAESEWGITLLRAARLGTLASPIAGRIVRRALLDLGALPEAGHVEAVIGLAAARPGRSIPLPGGLLARREREYVRLSRPSLRPA